MIVKKSLKTVNYLQTVMSEWVCKRVYVFDVRIGGLTLYRIRLWESKCEIQTKTKIVYSNFFFFYINKIYSLYLHWNVQSINIHRHGKSEAVCENFEWRDDERRKRSLVVYMKYT